MIGSLIAAVVVALATPTPSDLMTPRETTLEAYLRTSFDARYILPTSADWADIGVTDLPAAGTGLTSARYESGDAGEVGFGDAVARLLDVRGDRDRVDRALAKLRRESPALWRDAGPMLEQLGRTSTFDQDDWDPDTDEDDDGVFVGATLDLERIDARPWNDLDGASTLVQGCTLMVADLDAIKAAEGAYPEYPRDVGAAYEVIHPRANSLVVGEDEAGRPFQGLRVFCRTDLPFPFTTYDCDLRLLTRVRDDGCAVTDLHAKNDDFYWLAGRDVYVPLETSDGAFVATLVVRQFGFDLAGVPDGDGDRKAAVRSTLGNLRRRAERMADAADATPRVVRGTLPEPRVRGAR